ncbi:MAG: glycosyltransferase [Betaproteobacteria bacterium]|nr:glycosyltransferase [Betaproteobacteria bacterium]
MTAHGNAAPRLSVIVPVYNVAPYLPACLDSLAAQTRPIDEIILVDDGSSDACPDILRDYAARHANMRVIRQDNAGLSAARNTGLDHATGEWVGFVDSDDWADPRMFERLLALATTHGLDMALCNGRYHFDDGRPGTTIYTDPPLAGPVSGADWLAHKLANRTLLHMVWMHLYRRAFIEAHRLRFVRGLIHEDVIWTTRALALARRVAYDDAPLYFYRRPLRRFEGAVRDRRNLAVIASSKTNARELARLADGLDDRRLAGLIRWQLVDGGLSVFHKIGQISDPELARAQWRAARRDGYLGLLWRNCTSWTQRRKVVGRWLKAVLA